MPDDAHDVLPFRMEPYYGGGAAVDGARFEKYHISINKHDVLLPTSYLVSGTLPCFRKSKIGSNSPMTEAEEQAMYFRAQIKNLTN